ncbi:hypothetical protein ORI20_03185 [Mycobacterium sp. CVI_P3]|uniref:Uncharacterized protein n=1 Tax=Mycobacterium pinniadriaticum TaxID=2994102 RepID=A0ABT3S880_9MYCO|nr:hypothetical protein [Mycobacterium pinniadriaticum]MCX2929264.1 hypothetical protein [Mycobacterium pinniadriaticum]MCX2935689.1 hypothetical protein [Mycobacterium pinniadriaticum]
MKGLYIPITTFKKSLLIDLDVRDANGAAIAVATSDQDSCAAQACMLAALDPELRRNMPKHLQYKLYDIAKGMPTGRDEAILNSTHPPSAVDAWQLRDAIYTPADKDLWQNCLRDPEFKEYVARFTTQFSLLVWIPIEGPTCLIKFRILEVSELVPGDAHLTNRIGAADWLYAISAPNVGKAGREHLRVVAPEGTFIVDALLARQISMATPTDAAPTLSHDQFQYRITPGRVTLYTSHDVTVQADHYAFVTLRPLLRGFVWPAIVSALVAFLLLTMGSAGQLWRGALDFAGTNRSDATVAVLLLASTGLSAYIARENEHEIRARMLLLPRIAVAFTGAATLLAAIVTTIMNFSGHVQAIVWVVGAGYCALVIVYLVVVLFKNHSDFDRIVRSGKDSQDDFIAQF